MDPQYNVAHVSAIRYHSPGAGAAIMNYIASNHHLTEAEPTTDDAEKNEPEFGFQKSR